MNVKNEMPTGRITWINGIGEVIPRDVSVFVTLTAKKP